MRNLSLLRDGRLTTAAVLLFTPNPQALYPQSRVRIGRFKGIEILDSHDYEGSLWDQLDGAMTKFRDMLEVRFEIKVEEPTLEGLQRRDIWESPLEALREALINALIHRDYTISADIQVRVYDDQLAIWNPGGLPDGIRLEQLREPSHPSVLRNPLIAQVLYYAGVIERWGTGTTRIIGWCSGQGLPEPVFEEDADWFRLGFLRDALTPQILAEMGLHERQVPAVLWAKANGSISKHY